MPIIQPGKERHTLQDDGSSLKFIIPSRKKFFEILFLGIWSIFWAFGEVVVINIFATELIRAFFMQVPDNIAGISGTFDVKSKSN
jgi:hypothetical protein